MKVPRVVGAAEAPGRNVVALGRRFRTLGAVRIEPEIRAANPPPLRPVAAPRGGGAPPVALCSRRGEMPRAQAPPFRERGALRDAARVAGVSVRLAPSPPLR